MLFMELRHKLLFVMLKNLKPIRSIYNGLIEIDGYYHYMEILVIN